MWLLSSGVFCFFVYLASFWLSLSLWSYWIFMPLCRVQGYQFDQNPFNFSHFSILVSLDLPQQGRYKSRIHPQITTDIWLKLICGATVLFLDVKSLCWSFFAEISSAAALKMCFYLHFRFFPASCGLKQNRLTLVSSCQWNLHSLFNPHRDVFMRSDTWHTS